MNDFRVIDWTNLQSIDSNFFETGTAISIGGFDGLHLGHIALLEVLKKKSKGMLKGVLTFYTPPAYMLSSSSKHGLISTLRLKIEKLRRLGFDFALLVDFSLDFAKMGAEDFVGLLKKYLNLELLVVGSDFRFGYNRKCSIEDMRQLSRKFSFAFEALQPLLLDGENQKISSSCLRTSIYNGDISYVNFLLGQPFSIDLLGLTPFEAYGYEAKFRREDILQVLPESGEFKGEVSFENSVFDEKVKILLDESYLRLFFENKVLSKAEPYFDILKFI